MGFFSDVGDFIGDVISSPVSWVMGPVGFLGAGGAFGKDFQDFATMGKSAQRRAEARAKNEMEKAREEQAKIRREQNRQQYIQQIRTARIKRARAVTSSINEPGISSGALGGLSSLSSQFSNNLNYMQFQTNALNNIYNYQSAYNKEMAKASKYASYYEQGQGLLKLAMSAAGTAAGMPVGFSTAAAGDAVSAIGGSQIGTTAGGLPYYDVFNTAATGGNVRIY